MATVLVTGGNGYVGFKILLDLLTAGYSVRTTVRSGDRKKILLENKHVRRILSSRGSDALEIYQVPDILAPAAYNLAVSSGTIKHIIHTATPLPFPTKKPREDIIDPSILGTTRLLEASSRAPSVRRVVLTSSLVANLPFPPDQATKVTPADRLADPTSEQLDDPNIDFFSAYRYSKITALNAADDFVKGHKDNITFDIVNVFPGFVHGPNLLADSVATLQKGSNRLLLLQLTGATLPAPRLAGAAHIDDVSRVHIAALDESIVPFQSGIDLAATQPVEYDDAWKIVEKKYPDAVKAGILKQGAQASLAANWDASDTEKRCGIKFQSYEVMVTGLVDQYLELLEDQ